MKEEIVLGGGCFWCVEAGLQQARGVESVVSGYAGGSLPHPTYEQVCSGRSGHAEVVRVRFDPEQLPLTDLLRLFFALHDPTTPDRQGNDVGPQYRSVIFYQSEEQRLAADAVIAELDEERVFPDPIITQVEPLQAFYEAEEYHQNYFLEHESQPYCQVVIAPKLSNLRAHYASALR